MKSMLKQIPIIAGIVASTIGATGKLVNTSQDNLKTTLTQDKYLSAVDDWGDKKIYKRSEDLILAVHDGTQQRQNPGDLNSTAEYLMLDIGAEGDKIASIEVEVYTDNTIDTKKSLEIVKEIEKYFSKHKDQIKVPEDRITLIKSYIDEKSEQRSSLLWDLLIAGGVISIAIGGMKYYIQKNKDTNNINVTPEADDTEKEEDISSKINQTETEANSTGDSSEEQKAEYNYNRNHTELISEQAFQSNNRPKDKRNYLNKILPNVGKRKGNMSIGKSLVVILRSNRFDNEVFRKDKEDKFVGKYNYNEIYKSIKNSMCKEFEQIDDNIKDKLIEHEINFVIDTDVPKDTIQRTKSDSGDYFISFNYTTEKNMFGTRQQLEQTIREILQNQDIETIK